MKTYKLFFISILLALSWTEIDNPVVKNVEITALYFISEEIGFFANFNRDLYKTKDGGKTRELRNDSLDFHPYKMLFLNENEGYAVNLKPYIY